MSVWLYVCLSARVCPRPVIGGGHTRSPDLVRPCLVNSGGETRGETERTLVPWHWNASLAEPT